jgi:hypothetical protein
MDTVYRSLLLQYQNYFLEFYQLIDDKEIIKPKDLAKSVMVKDFLENLPEFTNEFEIEMQLETKVGELVHIWLAQFSDDGFSIRSYTLDDLDELEEWFFHYHDDTKEYEGNLYTDGDWDLFLEEIAEVDAFDGKEITASFLYEV